MTETKDPSHWITSFSNEKVKHIVKLRDKPYREEMGEFSIEGYREIKKALLNPGIDFKTLYISRECFLGENEDSLISEFRKRKVKIFEMPRKVFEKISYRDRPDGLLGISKIPNFSFRAESVPAGKTYLLIEGVEKPGNLGTILRTSEGAGVDCVFVTDTRVDLFNPNVIRASTGTLFTLPVMVGKREDILDFCKKEKIQIFAVTPEAKEYYYNKKLNHRSLFVFGSEQYGLSPEMKEACPEKISIPMRGNADSLNLAMSVGIILYDALRQKLIEK